jgi:AAHS family 4-hydroxybenzoate transporter-like MFS transporter
MALLCAAATEFFPAHFRSRAVSTMLIGMPVGGIVTGVLGAVLIPEHGWRSLFLIGGIAPICLVPFLASMMPRGGSGALMPKASGIGPWRDLFRGAPPSQTVITGAACFLGMLIAYSLANWAPTLLKSTNLSTKSAFLGASLLNMVSCFVMMSCGWLIDRFGLYRVAAIGFLVGAPFLVLIGFAQHLGPAALPVLIIGGLLILGTPVALPLLAADSYPPHLRVEAVSGYVAMSRSGAVIGPALAGVVIAYAGGIAAFFVMLALAAVVAGLAIIVLSRRKTAAAGLLEGL